MKILRSQFRMPEDIWEKLVAAAKEQGRSMNSELLYRLKKSFEEDENKEAA